MSNQMDKRQTGFVRGCGTGPNVFLLTAKMQTYRKTQGKCVLFIDFKSAYNTVDRDILWDIMSEKNILTANELQFLRYLHDKIYFVGNGERYYFKNGVG